MSHASGFSPGLLLASRSEARRKMLEAAGIPFRAVGSDVDEDQAKQGLVAAGFAEFQPLDTAPTEEAYKRNRRIELKLTER